MWYLITLLLNTPLKFRLSTPQNSSPTLHFNEDHSRTNDSNILWKSNAAEWVSPIQSPLAPPGGASLGCYGFLTLTQTAHYSPGPTDALDFIDLRPKCGCCRCSGDAPGIHLSNRRESCKPSRPWLTLIRVQCLHKSPVYLLFRSQSSVQKETKRALSFFL